MAVSVKEAAHCRFCGHLGWIRLLSKLQHASILIGARYSALGALRLGRIISFVVGHNIDSLHIANISSRQVQVDWSDRTHIFADLSLPIT